MHFIYFESVASVYYMPCLLSVELKKSPKKDDLITIWYREPESNRHVRKDTKF